MSVFTPLDTSEIKAIINQFDLGSFMSFKGVEEGVENSNFFISTISSSDSSNIIDEHVLTLFENLKKNELNYFIDLQNLLSNHDLPVPDPVKTKLGEYLIEVKGKPALLAPRIKGKHPVTPTLEQCEIIGETLAKMHVVSEKFLLSRKHVHDIKWLAVASHRLQDFLEPHEKDLIDNELQLFRSYDRLGYKLPSATIHGDLFRDNTLFSGNSLNGILDFYSACNYYCSFDLAVTVNDWCNDPNGDIDETAMQTLVDSYGRVRPFTQNEKEVWPVMLRYAACRFWLSRLMTKHLNPPSSKKEVLVKAKDPVEYEKRLLHLMDNSYHL